MKIKILAPVLLVVNLLLIPAVSRADSFSDFAALFKEAIQAGVSLEKNGPVTNYPPATTGIEIYRVRFENNSSSILSSPVFSVYTSNTLADKAPFTNFKFFMNGNPATATIEFPEPAAAEKTSVADVFGTDSYYRTGYIDFDSTTTIPANSSAEFIIKADVSADEGSKILFGLYSWSFINQTTQTLVVTPLKYGPINVTIADGSLVNDQGTIYVIELGKKRAIANMGVFKKLGYKLSNVTTGNTSAYAKGADLTTDRVRKPRGSLVLDKTTVYFLGQDLRYPFPSKDVFLSWGNKFENILPASSYDLQLPVGPVAQMKQ